MIREFTISHAWFIASAAWWTIVLTVVSLFFGSAIGITLAVLRQAPSKALRIGSSVLVRIFQGIPLVVVIFMIYFGIAILGINVSPFLACSVALSLFAGAFLGEIWRGSMQAIPQQQWEAAESLGLSPVERLRWVIIPQAVRMAMPATVGFIVQLVKGTSVASMVGYVELMRAGQVVNGTTFASFKVFGLVAALYLAINLPISLASRRLERMKI